LVNGPETELLDNLSKAVQDTYLQNSFVKIDANKIPWYLGHESASCLGFGFAANGTLPIFSEADFLYTIPGSQYLFWEKFDLFWQA
jgi:hypothetical protein